MAGAYRITDHGNHVDGQCQCEVRQILSEYVWAEPIPDDNRNGIIVLRGGWMLAERIQGATTARPLGTRSF
jgi:hypothetical protein